MMYNRFYGECPHADMLLFAIDLRREEFGRYRDTFLIDGCIVVFTRLGKDIKGEYEQTIKNLQHNRLYKDDFLDQVDDTYRYFRFRQGQAHFDEKMFEELDMRYIGRRFLEDYGF